MQTKQIFNISNFSYIIYTIVLKLNFFLVKLANFETLLLNKKLSNLAIKNPIYISGLSRSGSTLILELLDNNPAITSHKYKDFPFIFTPCFWHHLLATSQKKQPIYIERAHKDGVMISGESPEAFEEMIWMYFFKNLHTVEKTNVLSRKVKNPDFEIFYKNNILKMLLVNNCSQYVAKGNFNFSRFEYILSIFPSAKFLIPVRNPVDQVASLIRTHKLFKKGHSINHRALKYFELTGHFEFGLSFKPVNIGKAEVFSEILRLFDKNQDVLAWSKYWNYIYSYIFETINKNEEMKKASLFIKYEDLCFKFEQTLNKINTHCLLNPLVFSKKIIFSPKSYSEYFTKTELEIIITETKETAVKYSYDL